MAELLARFGARRESVPIDEEEGFVQAVLPAIGAGCASRLTDRPEYLRSHRALFAAVNQGRPDVIRFLLDLGVSAEVEKPGYAGQRALHLAAAKDQVGCARMLLDHGAEVDPRDSVHQATPLGWAVWFGNNAVAEMLGPQSRDLWPLAYTGQARRISQLLDTQPGLARSVNDSGETLLMWLPDDDAAALAMARTLVGARRRSGRS